MSSNITWVDSHCHLEKSKEPLETVIANSKELNVNRFISIGTDHESNLLVDQFSKSHPEIFATVGYHPHDASDFKQDHYDWMKQATYDNKKIIAIGECGLDYHYNYSDEASQKRVFADQLNLALELDLPVVIHTRNAEQDTIDILESFPKDTLKGVFHCFTSSMELAKYALDKGFYLSFNGICTFPKSGDVREILINTPLERILLETDSPFLAPVPYRGKINFPGNVSIVGEFIANLLNMESEAFARITEQNIKNLFPRYNQ